MWKFMQWKLLVWDKFCFSDLWQIIMLQALETVTKYLKCFHCRYFVWANSQNFCMYLVTERSKRKITIIIAKQQERSQLSP